MRTIQTLLEFSAADGTLLLASLAIWATVILGIAWAIVALARRASPAVRYCLWQFALLGLLIVPVLFVSMPGVPLGFSLLPGTKAAESLAVEPTPIAEPPSELATDRAHLGRLMRSVVAQAEAAPLPAASPRQQLDAAVAASAAGPALAKSIAAAAAPGASVHWPWPTMLLGVWAAGLVLHGLWLIYAAALVKRLLRSARRVKHVRFRRMLHDLRRRHQIRPPVRLLTTDQIAAPLVVGAFRPAILLPRDYRRWSGERLALVLSHELAHIQRRDLFWQLLARVSAAVYWFHPLVWLAVRRMRLERERACDDRVLLAGIEPTEYATGLVECAAELRGRPLQLALGISMAQPSQLETRIRSILDASLTRGPVSAHMRRGIVVGTTLLVLTLSVLRPFSPIASKAAQSPPEANRQTAAESEPADAQSSAASPASEAQPAASEGTVAPSTATQPAATQSAVAESTEAAPVAVEPAVAKVSESSPPQPAAATETDNSASTTPPPTKTTPAAASPATPPTSHAGGVVEDQPKATPATKTVFVNNPAAPLVKPLGEVWTCTLSGNDKFLAICGGGEWMNRESGWARIWDVETKQEVASYDAPRGILCISLSPDGRRVAYATWDSDAVLREVGGRELRKLTIKRHPRVAFSPDGFLLVVADERKEMRVLDGMTGNDLDGFGGDKMECMWIGFSADGSLLGASGGAFAEAERNKSPQVAVWDVASRRQVFKATGLPNRVYISALSPDNKTFAAACNNLIWLYDLPTGTLREQIKTPHSFIRGLRFSPDGSTLASSGGDDGAIVLWDTATWQPVGTLSGHSSRVRGLSFTHDGKTLISAGSDQAVLLWDVASRTQSGVLQQPVAKPSAETEAPRFLAIAYAPGGEQVAAAGEDGKVSIYDLASGKVLHSWQAHDDAVAALAYSSDGQTLASGGYDKVVQLWNPASGEPLRKLSGHKGWVVSLAFSPDGSQLASGSYDRSIVVWQTADGAQRRVLQGHSATVRSLAFSPDQKLLASGSADRTVKLWDAVGGADLATLTGHEGAVRGVAFSPDGKTLASGGEDRLVKLWNVDDHSLRATLTGHADMVSAVAFVGPTLVSASWDHSIRTWDSQTGAQRAKLDAGNDPVIALAVAPDGKQLLSASVSGIFKVWKAAQGNDQPTSSFGPFAGNLSAALSPDANLVAVGTGGGDNGGEAGTSTLSVIGRADGSEKFKVDLAGDLHSLAWSPRGDTLAVGFVSGELALLDAATGSELVRFEEHGSGLAGLAFSADGRLLASASPDRVVRVYEVAKRELDRRLRGHKAGVLAVAFSPDGTKLLSSCEDHSAIVWNLETGERLYALPQQRSSMRSVAWSGDGRLLATGCQNGECQLWEARGGQPIRTMKASGAALVDLSFSPDSRLLASAGADNLIRLWDVGTGEESFTYAAHTGPVRSARFSADGKLLLSAGADGMAKIWPVSAQ